MLPGIEKHLSRVEYLNVRKSCRTATPEELDELRNMPLMVGDAMHGDDTAGGVLFIPRLPGMSDDNTTQENMDAWVASGTGQSVETVRAERLAAEQNLKAQIDAHRASMADAVTADQPAPVDDSPMAEVPTPQLAPATPQVPTAQPAQLEWELDARGNRIPKKKRWWIKPAR